MDFLFKTGYCVNISANSGFETPTHLKALFRKTFGMTMRDYRKRTAEGTDPSRAFRHVT